MNSLLGLPRGLLRGQHRPVQQTRYPHILLRSMKDGSNAGASSGDLARQTVELFKKLGKDDFEKSLSPELLSFSVINELSRLADEDPEVEKVLQAALAVKEGLSAASVRPPISTEALAAVPVPSTSASSLSMAPRLADLDKSEVAALLLEASVQGWAEVAERQQQTSLDYGVTATSNRDWALTSGGLNQGLDVAADLDAFIRAQKKKTSVEIIGRKQLDAPESARALSEQQAGSSSGTPPAPEGLFAPDATFRILEFLLEVEDDEERKSLLAEAFVPPEDGGEADEEADEDQLFTTPLRLLQAIDLEIKQEQKAGEAMTAGLLKGGSSGGAEARDDEAQRPWIERSRESRLRSLRDAAWGFCSF